MAAAPAELSLWILLPQRFPFPETLLGLEWKPTGLLTLPLLNRLF